jgi:hypothetical protein
MLDRIRDKSETLAEHIAAKKELYTRMRAIVRSKITTSESCRRAIAQSTEKPDKRTALLMYNRVFDLANITSDAAATAMIKEVAETLAIGITLRGERYGPAEYTPVATAA